MKTVSVKELRRSFSKVEELLRRGETVQITKRHRAIARLVPEIPESQAPMPDFLERLHAIYGNTLLSVSGADLIAQDRKR